jgi:hypothetical protein
MPVTVEDQNGCPFPIADVYVPSAGSGGLWSFGDGREGED